MWDAARLLVLVASAASIYHVVDAKQHQKTFSASGKNLVGTVLLNPNCELDNMTMLSIYKQFVVYYSARQINKV